MAEFAHHAEERRHFVRRLEAFGDIVYGFSLSQTGFALVVPARPGDLLEHPGSLLGGALSFIAICIWWLGYHRMYANAFVAERIDVFLNFGVLGTVAFLPFALRFWVQFGNDPHGGLLYGANFAISTTLMTILQTRGYLRFGRQWSDALRLRMWRAILRYLILAFVFALTLVAWNRFGPQGAWCLAILWLLPCLRFIRRAPVPPARASTGGTLGVPAGS